MSDQRPPELILIRHGQTDWNIARRYQGQTETDLNETGRAQMRQAAERLAATTLIGQVVTSPLRRAFDSAVIVARPHGLSVVPDPRLMELHLGRWQGEAYAVRDENDSWFEMAPHGGEGGSDFCDRIREWLDGFQPTGNRPTVLVSHGLVIQVILMLISNETFEYWHNRPIKNGAFTVLRWENSAWQLKRFNDANHLSDAC